MHLSGLSLYPLKSGAGIAVAQWRLDDRGLQHDRSFMVVDAGTGCFLTQRQEPSLALVRPSIGPGTLSLATPEGSVAVALVPEGPPMQVRIWEHNGPAIDCGQAAAELLSSHLGRSVRLVGLAQQHDRSADHAYAGSGVQVALSDGFPLLLTGTASLAALNGRLAQPLPMNRFRPNLVVAGAPAFAEDGWNRILIGGIAIDLVKPCTRCRITTVDQATGRLDGAEPLRALGAFRLGPKGVLFGQNAVHRSTGTLRVGDPVVVQ